MGLAGVILALLHSACVLGGVVGATEPEQRRLLGHRTNNEAEAEGFEGPGLALSILVEKEKNPIYIYIYICREDIN